MYTSENVVIGSATPPTGTIYCPLSVHGCLRSRAGLFVESSATTRNLKKITNRFRNSGNIFAKGLYLSNRDLANEGVPNDLESVPSGGLVVHADGNPSTRSDITAAVRVRGGIAVSKTVHCRNLAVDNSCLFEKISVHGTDQPVSNTDTNAAMYVAGGIAVAGTIIAQEIISMSDATLKKNVQTVPGNLVENMRGVSYVWKESGEHGYGVIADELREVVPGLVRGTPGSYHVNYGGLTGYLIEAIKQLAKRVQHLESLLF